MIILTVPIPVIRIIITMTSIIASTTDSHLPFTCGRGRSRPWTALSADPPASWVDGCCHTWTWAWWPRPGLPSAGWPMLQVLTWRLTHTFPLDISVSLLRCGARLFTTNERNIYVFSSLSWYEKTHIHHHFADISHSVLDSAVCYSGQNFSLCFDSDSDPFTYSLPRETPQAWLVAALPSRVAATVLLCDATSNHKLLRRVQTFPVPSRFCVMVARPTKPQHTSPFAERISACIHKPRRHISDNALLCLNFLSVRYLLYGVIVATLLRWFTKTFKPNMTLFGTSYALYRQTFLSRNARHPNDPSEIKCRHELWIQTRRRWGRVR